MYAREEDVLSAVYYQLKQYIDHHFITKDQYKQPAMDLSRDKNAEEMKWSPLEMGAAMQAHGA